MSFDLNGEWENSYGSLMTLVVGEDGEILGSYSSTTGSTGKYAIVGQTSPTVQSGKGRAVVFSLYWRPTNTEVPDESWHWMSTYCGQLLATGELSLINSLVATSTFGEFGPGDFIDKLSFTKRSDLAVTPTDIKGVKQQNTGLVENPINGQWVDMNDGVKLAFEVQNVRYGFVTGEANYLGKSFPIFGFTDTELGTTRLQSVSVCGYVAEDDLPLSLSGWLDLDNNSLQLTRWVANATTPENVYYQADAASWRFIRN